MQTQTKTRFLAIACWAILILPPAGGCSGNPDAPTAAALNKAGADAQPLPPTDNAKGDKKAKSAQPHVDAP